MKVTLKTGRKEGFVSSYNLFFEDGLRLQTEDMTWLCVEDRVRIRAQFEKVVEQLRATGWTIEGTL